MQFSLALQKRFIPILFLALAVAAQHDHGPSHHGEPKSEWDEEEYLRWNPPTPPSYWSEDTRMQMSPEEELPARYPWLMVLHILFMSGAFFVALPAGEYFSHFVLPFHGSHNPRHHRKPRGRIAFSHTHTLSGPCRAFGPITHSYLSIDNLSRDRFEIRKVALPRA